MWITDIKNENRFLMISRESIRQLRMINKQQLSGQLIMNRQRFLTLSSLVEGLK